MDALIPSLRSAVIRKLPGGGLLRSEAGSTTLEFAVAIPVVVLLVFGSMAVMLGLRCLGDANYATGIAARYAALHSETSDTPASSQTIAEEVRSHLWLSSQSADITANWSNGNTPGSQVIVTTTITTHFAIPLTNVHSLTISVSAIRAVTR